MDTHDRRPPGPRDSRGPNRGPSRGPDRGPPRGPARDGFAPRGPHSGPPRTPRPQRPKGPAPELIHRDRDLLVVVKPSGMPCRRGRGLTLVGQVQEHFAARRERYRPIHELDDVASGVVALVPLRDDDPDPEFRSQVTYLVLAEGAIDTGDAAERALTGPVPGLEGKSSAPVSSVRPLSTANGVTLLRVRARPDAPGQIRTHLAAAGHTVIGDVEHGSTRDDLKRVAIHALESRLRHPKTGETERYRCPAPASFYRAAGMEPPAASRSDEIVEPDPQSRGWDEVAGWYDDLITSRGSDHHERTVLPGTERLLDIQPGERYLDIACGQGILCQRLAQLHQLEEAVGVDASTALIEHARERAQGNMARPLQSPLRYEIADAQDLGAQQLGQFDAATSVLALMNIPNLDAVFAGVADSLKPGGRFVAVILHPAFRAPESTAWGWTTDGRTGVPIQYRRVDRYMSERASAITMNPGEAAAGKPAVTTTTHHRPIGAYISSLARAGLAVDALEEWVSDRTSQDGPRANAENLARAEIPMFLAFRARKHHR